ncbi:hypothetical protein [Fredinandcohnia sp. 179-A 10B2 NHS]|uniref:hypothetical protein n=1 Tax=Fredinandcohnia sp. 179-A 10B2 NHS TaxID=3235176 RepID=UPI0039A2B80F
MRGSIFWIGISIIILSWIGNYIFFQSKQLDTPLFLEHYYETSINEEDEIHLPFYYITNKSDSSTVSYVNINGEVVYPEPDAFNMWDTDANTPQFEQEFTHHYLKSVLLTFPILPGDELWKFSGMDVHFSDGKTVHADIGQVIMKKTESTPIVFETRMSGSDSDHLSQQTLLTTQPITINKIEVPFEELSQDVLLKIDREQERLSELETLRSNGDFPSWYHDDWNKEWKDLPGKPVEDLLPLSMDKDEWIRLFMQFDSERASYYQFSIKMVGKTDSGETFINEMPIIDHPGLTQQKITNLIESKKSGDVH